MSINHFSPDIPEALWWTQQHQQQQQRHQHNQQQQQSMNMEHHHHHQNMSLNFNLNQYDVVEEDEEEDHKKTNNELPDGGERDRETMFEKPLTPSDVGKLNRLVIPKQHAEKYFPLNNHNHQHHHSNGGGGGGDSVSGGENKGGLLLSFEDESGKWWRFRYSYWNSSQSYVLTKGWSRYVKEKSLYAGDVVLFERHRSDLDRFFIGWRRRDTPPPIDSHQPTLGGGGGGGNNDGGASSSGGGGGGGWTRVFYSAHPYPSHPFPYQPDCLHAGSMEVGEAKTTPVGNSKRLIRLFGVNMECEQDESESSMSVSNQSQDHQGQGEPQNVHNYSYYNPETHGYPIHHNHMIQQDVNFSRDVNQMINRRG